MIDPADTIRALSRRTGIDADLLTEMFNERAAIREYEGNATRRDAELGERPSGVVTGRKTASTGFRGGYKAYDATHSYDTDDTRPSRYFYSPHTRGQDRRMPDTGEPNPHECPKPSALMQWLVRLVTPPGGIVLDPFMGSGTTGKAAMHEGLRFIGIELDPGYHAIAERRIKHAAAQGRMF